MNKEIEKQIDRTDMKEFRIDNAAVDSLSLLKNPRCVRPTCRCRIDRSEKEK